MTQIKENLMGAGVLTQLGSHISIMLSQVLVVVLVALSLGISMPASADATTQALTEVTGLPSTETTTLDPFGRQTPRSTVQGFIKALADNDNALAANYLSLARGDNAVETVRKLNLALDAGGRLDAELQISNDPAGNLSDRLPPNQERVGEIKDGDRSIDILLVRQQSDQGNQYWQFAPETLKAIRSLKFNDQPRLVERYTPEALKGKSIDGYSVEDILAVLILSLIGIVASYIVVGILFLLVRWAYPKVRGKPLPVGANVILPMALVITAMILAELMLLAGVSVTVREPVNRMKDIVAWFALTWLLLRVIDALFDRAERQSLKRNHAERVSILSLLRKVVKALLLVFATIFIFGNLGFDLTTGIAALGVGGLALALGAQKLIENLVGSVVVVADQPVRVGDYCRFGTMEGTVIDVGIRSTRLRTLDRTIVTVPNGEFSSMKIENFTARDMYHFNHQLYLKRTASAAALKTFLQGMNDFIRHHPLTNDEFHQVRIAELRQDCIVIEIRAYISASSVTVFFDLQSELVLDLLAQVEKYEVEHALPTQQMLLQHIAHTPTEDDATTS